MLKYTVLTFLILLALFSILLLLFSTGSKIYSDEELWNPKGNHVKVRLYLFDTGNLQINYEWMAENTRVGEKVWIPVEAFLIVHPRGKVLFDTGFHPSVETNPEEHLGKDCYGVGPITIGYRMVHGQDVVSQIKKLGYSINDIDYVVNSHLHFEHTGCNEFFSRSTFLIQKEELKEAYTRSKNEWAYRRKDFDLPFKFRTVKGDYDIFGDRTVVILYTPGHTRGHQSLLVKLQSGPIILAADACYVMHNILELKLPKTEQNPTEAMKSILRIKKYKENWRAKIIPGHDPDFWSELKKAPDFYE